MPRGDNPNSRANLIPQQNLSSEEVRKRGSKGGIASVESRQARKTFQQRMLETEKASDQDKMIEAIRRRAMQGNLKAFEIYRDTIGEKPIDRIMLAEVDQDTIDEVEAIFNE